jgi:integrase
MRKRFQTGSVTKSKDGRYWVGQWRDDDATGKRVNRSRILGKVSRMTKTEARKLMADIVKPINERATPVGRVRANITVKDFVEEIYLPFYRRKWKRITAESRTANITYHIVGDFGNRELRSLQRTELQEFLDKRKDRAFTVVDHLRWDLKQILDLAVAEGVITRNPVYVPPGTMLLFVPKECAKPDRPVMTIDEVKKALAVLGLRERLVFKLGVFAGMRCSEIFGLRRGRVYDGHLEVLERVCRRDVDTPKTEKSVRQVALSSTVEEDLKLWLVSTRGGPDDWLFPSENPKMPMGADNMMARHIRPRLKPEEVGLGWVDYRVMRRTHSSLMNDLSIDPKVVADQQGHTVDVNLNVYTQTSIESRQEAAETLASAFVN